jgi:4-hydroxy-2-oxoheptanedioate aldolase
VPPTPAIGADAGLRALLRRRERLLATFLMLPRVEIVEMLAGAGFDAVVVDLEHAPIESDQLPALAAAGRGAGIAVIARLGSSEPAGIAKVLDTGVDGLLVPHVGSARAAADVVSAARYPPDGTRSLNPYVRATRYDRGPAAGKDGANAWSAVIAMLEGADAIAELDGICDVAGLDGVFVGPVDLSAALGVPGDPEHPSVVEAVTGVLARARSHDVATGLYAPTPEAAARWFGQGASLVALSADIAMASASFAAASAQTGDLLSVPDGGSP